MEFIILDAISTLFSIGLGVTRFEGDEALIDIHSYCEGSSVNFTASCWESLIQTKTKACQVWHALGCLLAHSVWSKLLRIAMTVSITHFGNEGNYFLNGLTN